MVLPINITDLLHISACTPVHGGCGDIVLLNVHQGGTQGGLKNDPKDDPKELFVRQKLILHIISTDHTITRLQLAQITSIERSISKSFGYWKIKNNF